MHLDYVLISLSLSSSVHRSARFASVPFDAVRGPTEALRRHFYFNIRNRKMPLSQISSFDFLDECLPRNNTLTPLTQ